MTNLSERLEIFKSIKPSKSFFQIMKSLAIKETKELTEKYYFQEEKISALGESVRNAVLEKELFGCQRGNVLDVLSIYMEENLKDQADQIDFGNWYCLVVPLIDRNGHGYPLNEPLMTLGSTRAVKIDGTFGANIDYRRRSLRPATLDEIDKFFETVPETSILGCFLENNHYLWKEEEILKND